MNRKLLALNLVLGGLAVAAGFEFHSLWVADHVRESRELTHKVRPIPGPPFTPAQAPAATLPANFARVAQNDLFDRSRNPDVIPPPPPAPPPLPPPPPMPPLPVYRGAMNIGDGPLAVMSVSAQAKHEAIKPGEMIGQFKLLDITPDDLTLEWNGQKVRKQLWELQNNTLPQQDQQAVDAAQSAPPPPPAPEVRQESKGPGDTSPFGSRGCQPGDTDPVGTIKDGYRKVSVPTPFGAACLWDPVK